MSLGTVDGVTREHRIREWQWKLDSYGRGCSYAHAEAISDLADRVTELEATIKRFTQAWQRAPR